MIRSRAWLRSFLKLGARQHEEHISDEAIRLQEDTVLRALDIMDREPGVLLADEVGMGKTFQALGLIASLFHRHRDPRILVVTPRKVLNDQWLAVAKRFDAQGFFPARFPPSALGSVDHLTQLPDTCKKHQVVFAPVTVFAAGRRSWERGAVLAIWFKARGFAGPTCKAIRARLQMADYRFEEHKSFLGHPLKHFLDAPDVAFRRIDGDGRAGLDDLYDQGFEAFTSRWSVSRAVDRARFYLVRMLLPRFDLLVIDEAHKLKNPWTVQAQAVSQVLAGSFEKAAFLTATPFQLGVGELRQVFRLFSRARHVRESFAEDVDGLFDAIRGYQSSYDAFERAWRYLEPDHLDAFGDWYRQARRSDGGRFDDIDDPNVHTMARQAWALRQLKREQIEPGFRRWTIRSLKPGKDERRDTQTKTIEPADDVVVPLILYQRLVAERSRVGRRTHITAADTNISSSFSAAVKGGLMTEPADEETIRAYQSLLTDVLATEDERHPKVKEVVDAALGAGVEDEKMLIFCERNATVAAIQKRIGTRWMGQQLKLWQRHYPKATHTDVFGQALKDDTRSVGAFQKLATRFTRGQDQLSIALREALPMVLFVPPGASNLPKTFWKDAEHVLAEANKILGEQRADGTAATRLDYRIARRCVDVAVAKWFEDNNATVFEHWGGIAKNILAPNYVAAGLDGILDDEEERLLGNAPTPIRWSISRRTFDTLVARGRPSIWFPFREQLAGFDVELRRNIVDAVRVYLTRRDVPFLVELLGRAGGPSSSSAKIRRTLETWWLNPSCRWRVKVQELLEYLPRLDRDGCLSAVQDSLNGSFVQSMLDSGSRTRRQNAFNTPFYPMVVVGNQTMQEGLDLHRHCRTVVHHDLRWNPADLEQRTGRVDRHGSLSQRREKTASGEEWRIVVRYPILNRTIDPHMFQTVKEREKWLEFLLGRPPEAGLYDLDAESVFPLPRELSEDLRIDLSPNVDTTAQCWCPSCRQHFVTEERSCPGCGQEHYNFVRPPEMLTRLHEAFKADGTPKLRRPRKDDGYIRAIEWLPAPEQREVMRVRYDPRNPTGIGYRARTFGKETRPIYAYGWQTVDADKQRRMAWARSDGLELPEQGLPDHELHHGMIWMELVGESTCVREYEDRRIRV